MLQQAEGGGYVTIKGKHIPPSYWKSIKPLEDAVENIVTPDRCQVVKLRADHLAIAFEALRRGTAQDMFGNIAHLKAKHVVVLSVNRPDRDGQNHYRFEFPEFIEYEVEVL